MSLKSISLSLKLRKQQRQSTIASYFQVNTAAEQLYRQASGPARLAEPVIAAEAGGNSGNIRHPELIVFDTACIYIYINYLLCHYWQSLPSRPTSINA